MGHALRLPVMQVSVFTKARRVRIRTSIAVLTASTAIQRIMPHRALVMLVRAKSRRVRQGIISTTMLAKPILQRYVDQVGPTAIRRIMQQAVFVPQDPVWLGRAQQGITLKMALVLWIRLQLVRA